MSVDNRQSGRRNTKAVREEGTRCRLRCPDRLASSCTLFLSRVFCFGARRRCAKREHGIDWAALIVQLCRAPSFVCRSGTTKKSDYFSPGLVSCQLGHWINRVKASDSFPPGLDREGVMLLSPRRGRYNLASGVSPWNSPPNNILSKPPQGGDTFFVRTSPLWEMEMDPMSSIILLPERVLPSGDSAGRHVDRACLSL
jgi:hypothetical protein